MKLVDYFSKKREGQFKSRIERASSLDEVVREITREFEFYAIPGNEYLNDLTANQARISLALISLIRAMHGEGVHTAIESSPAPDRAYASLDGRREAWDLSRILPVPVGSAAVGLLCFSLGPVVGIIGAAAGGTAAVILANHFADRASGRRLKSREEKPQVVEIDADAIVNITKALMGKVDIIVDEFSPKPIEKEAVEMYRQYPEVMRFFQSLFAAGNSFSAEQFSQVFLPQLQSILRGLGYEQKEFSLDAPISELSHCFEIAYSKESDTRVPGIICLPIFKGDELVLKGKLLLSRSL